MHSPEQLEPESTRHHGLLELVEAGIESYSQNAYRDFLGEINTLSDTRAGAQLNPGGKPFFGEDKGSSIYIQRRGKINPMLVLESKGADQKVETRYTVQPKSDKNNQLEGIKQIINTGPDKQKVPLPLQKMSLFDTLRLTSLMRKMNQNYKSSPPHERSGSFLND